MKFILHKDSLADEPIRIDEEVLNDIKNRSFKNLIYLTEADRLPNKVKKETEDYVLIYCLTGKGQIETMQGTFKLRSNQFMLLQPNQFYNYQAEVENPWEIYCLHFNGNMINELNSTFDLKKYAFPSNIDFDSEILDSWREIFNSLPKGFSAENLTYANLCLYRYVSFFLFPKNQQQKPVDEPEKEDQLNQSISFMKANVHKRLSVDEIAEAFKYSPSHYSVLFKQKTGLSPIEYFIRIKIQHASKLLTGTNLIVKEVAGKVGYDDPFYFTRIFKKVTGKTPRAYKDLYRVSFKKPLELESMFAMY